MSEPEPARTDSNTSASSTTPMAPTAAAAASAAAATAAADDKRGANWLLRSWTSSSEGLSKRFFMRLNDPEAAAVAAAAAVESFGLDELPGNGRGRGRAAPSIEAGTATEYRTYSRRWFGLAQLTLMNVMVSWVWLTYAPVASSSAAYYGVDVSAINWLSTAFLLAFVAAFPVTILILNRGLRLGFSCAAVLLLVGSWVRYAGSSSSARGSFAAAMIGQMLVGFAQPLVLSAPAKFSDTWFTDRGRVAATALPSLANPFGAALGQLIVPMWVNDAGDVSRMVLYVAILSTVCAVPSFFVSSRPPTPAGPSSETPKMPLGRSIRTAARSLELWLIFAAFSVYVGLFNAISTLINQIMVPYGFSDNEAGIGGGVLIVVGLVAATISSPILDRTKAFVPAIKALVSVIALCYLAFIWMPQTRTITGPYVVLALLGAACFALLPVAIEFLADLSHPISPELTSTTAWAGGQLLGAVFIILGNALVAGDDADPPNNMKRFLVLQAVLAIAPAPMVLALGLFGRKDKLALRRLQRAEHQWQDEQEEASEPTFTTTAA